MTSPSFFDEIDCEQKTNALRAANACEVIIEQERKDAYLAKPIHVKIRLVRSRNKFRCGVRLDAGARC